MRAAFESFAPGCDIPAADYVKNPKLAKYFSRNTAAAVVCAAKLLDGKKPAPQTPFYYSHGMVGFEDYGLEQIANNCSDDRRLFSHELFVKKAIRMASPMAQFKVLYNMPQCFISIEWGLVGDNAVIYASARALLHQALYAPVELPILLGAGKVHDDGTVEAGFALADKKELQSLPPVPADMEAIDLFRRWQEEL